MLVGGIGLLDLRLAGAFASLDLRDLARAVTPIGVAGFLILLASGSILFAADARALAGSDMFRLKLILVALALLNMMLFRLAFGRLMLFGATRPAMRLMGVLSLGLWLGVLVSGRMIAYS
jgi:hypothetical protein